MSLTARVLRAEGLTYRSIAELSGVSHSTAYRWCNPDAAERHRATVREWDRANRAHKSRGEVRRVLAQSGRVCGACGGASVGRFCRPCTAKRTWVRLKLVQRLWSQGLETGEIARRLQVPVGTASSLVHRARAEGLYLPRRVFYDDAQISERAKGG